MTRSLILGLQGLDCTWTRQQLDWQPAQSFEVALAELVDFLQPSKTHKERVRLIHDAVEAAAERLLRDARQALATL